MNINDLAFIAEVKRVTGEDRRLMAFQTNLQVGWYSEEFGSVLGIALNPRGSIFYARVQKSSANYLQKRNLENGSLISEITGSYQPIVVDSNDRLWAFNPDYATTLFLFNSDLNFATIDLDSDIDSLKVSKDFRYLVGYHSSATRLKTFYSNGSFIKDIFSYPTDSFAFDDESNILLNRADSGFLFRKDVFATTLWSKNLYSSGNLLVPWCRIKTATEFITAYNDVLWKGTLIKFNLDGTELGSVTFSY